MKSFRKILRKYAVLLALPIAITLFLPETLFAKGAVIGYVYGKRIDETTPSAAPGSFPSNAQLEKLTHVMAVDVYPDANGNLHTQPNNET